MRKSTFCSLSSMDLQNCWHSNIGVHFLYIGIQERYTRAWHSIWPMDGRSYSIFCTYSSRFSIVTLDTGWLFVCPKNLTPPSLHKKWRGTKKLQNLLKSASIRGHSTTTWTNFNPILTPPSTSQVDKHGLSTYPPPYNI